MALTLGPGFPARLGNLAADVLAAGAMNSTGSLSAPAPVSPCRTEGDCTQGGECDLRMTGLQSRRATIVLNPFRGKRASTTPLVQKALEEYG
jgi:hypothetical protein